MHTVRRRQTSPGRRLRHARTLLAGTAVIAATLSVAGLTATAQAQPVTHLAVTKLSVPLGVATYTKLPSCSSGTASPSSSPSLPNTVSFIVTGVKSKISGVFTSTGSYTITIACSSGPSESADLKVEAAPPEDAAVGLGANTQQFLVDQFSGDYNSTGPKTHLYNWDATNPDTGAIGDSIVIKDNCAAIARPDGSSAGIKQLATFATTSDKKYFCDNFANSSRPRGSSDPPYTSGGVAFTALAGDAVSWSKPAVDRAAPASLTPTQLAAIFTCSDTNWDQVGGKNQTIAPFLPQAGSGTLSFFLAAIGVTTPGPCVSTASNTLEENEGDNSVFDNKGAIFIYSVGDYIAQRFHSPACTDAGCTGTTGRPPCTPQAGKNEFGCNTDGKGTAQGVMKPGEINGVKPTTGSGGSTVINTGFPSAFQRILYEVVPYDPNTSDHIPGSESGAPGGVDLEKIFGASGWACTNSTAKQDIRDYGFLTIPVCGTTD
jgi:ABC-type phosphate transport system substrate-binding protein